MSDDAKQALTITVSGISVADARGYAEELKGKLLDTTPDVSDIQIQSGQSNTQDPGSMLILLLGTPVAVELAKGLASGLAKGIAAFLQRRPNAKLDVVLPNGTTVHLKADSGNVADIVRALAH
jgi:hypothetical protein